MRTKTSVTDDDDDEARRRRKLGKAEGACVNTPGCSSGSQKMNKDARSWP